MEDTAGNTYQTQKATGKTGSVSGGLPTTNDVVLANKDQELVFHADDKGDRDGEPSEAEGSRRNGEPDSTMLETINVDGNSEAPKFHAKSFVGIKAD